MVNLKSLRCKCGSSNLKLGAGFDGRDDLSTKGEGSGYDIEVYIECLDCGIINAVGRIKKFSDMDTI
jgi:hypothetical protein